MKRATILLSLLIFSTTIGYSQKECPATMKDYDGNTYKTVLIGKQCWMAENIRAKHNGQGKLISESAELNSSDQYRYIPNGDVAEIATYGYLYNWMSARWVCPGGWHLPTDAEWSQLEKHIGRIPQYCCDGITANNAKALASTSGWKNDSSKDCAVGNIPEANNATGFSALPAGSYTGGYEDFSYTASFWSATSYSEDASLFSHEGAYFRYITYDGPVVFTTVGYKYVGHSVRCVQDY